MSISVPISLNIVYHYIPGYPYLKDEEREVNKLLAECILIDFTGITDPKAKELLKKHFVENRIIYICLLPPDLREELSYLASMNNVIDMLCDTDVISCNDIVRQLIIDSTDYDEEKGDILLINGYIDFYIYLSKNNTDVIRKLPAEVALDFHNKEHRELIKVNPDNVLNLNPDSQESADEIINWFNKKQLVIISSKCLYGLLKDHKYFHTLTKRTINVYDTKPNISLISQMTTIQKTVFRHTIREIAVDDLPDSDIIELAKDKLLVKILFDNFLREQFPLLVISREMALWMCHKIVKISNAEEEVNIMSAALIKKLLEYLDIKEIVANTGNIIKRKTLLNLTKSRLKSARSSVSVV